MILRRLLMLATFVNSACSCSPVIRSEDYDRTCTADADCVAVATGDLCTGCSCPNAAIRTSALTAFERDKAAILAACSPFGAKCLAECVVASAKCTNGQCGITTR